MAKFTENFIAEKPFADIWRAVHVALTFYNWNIVNVRDNTFFLKERLSFETMLWRNPCRFAVHVRREDDSRTQVFLIGSTLGFGPLPKGRLRRVSDILKNQLLGTIAQIPEEPDEPDKSAAPGEPAPDSTRP